MRITIKPGCDSVQAVRAVQSAIGCDLKTAIGICRIHTADIECRYNADMEELAMCFDIEQDNEK